MQVKLDASTVGAAYSAAFQRLKQLPGFDHRKVLRAEAGSILKRWAGLVPVAKPEESKKRARLRLARQMGLTKAGTWDITINVGIKSGTPGVVWYRSNSRRSRASFALNRGWRWQYAGEVSDSGAFTPAWVHFPDEAWAQIKNVCAQYGQRLAKEIPAAQKSVGLARQSVIQIADQLGIDLIEVAGGGISAAGITKARAAIASNGNIYQNGSGAQAGDDVKYYVELINRMPRGLQIGIDRMLLQVISGRAKFIETAYAKGAFDSIEKTAKAFPNILKFTR